MQVTNITLHFGKAYGIEPKACFKFVLVSTPPSLTGSGGDKKGKKKVSHLEFLNWLKTGSTLEIPRPLK